MNKRPDIPEPFARYQNRLPLLKEAVSWQQLQVSGITQTWRFITHEGQSEIVKWTTGSRVTELPIYRELLPTLGVIKPTLHAFVAGDYEQVFIIEDVGTTTLMQRQEAELILEAARTLIRIRHTATQRLQANQDLALRKFITPSERFLADLHYLRSHPYFEPAARQIFTRALTWLPTPLTEVYKAFPLSLTHNDYLRQNLVIADHHEQSIIPVDWATAEVNPLMTDLYILSHEVRRTVAEQALVDFYRYTTRQWNDYLIETEQMPLEWQLQLGGICTMISSIRWILDEGQYAIANAGSWLPKMVLHLERRLNKAQQLEQA